MGEVDEAPETRTVPIDPNAPRSHEDSSPSIDEGPDLQVIEALAEEDITWRPPIAVASPSKERDAPTAPALAGIAPVLDVVKGLGEQLTRRLDSLQAILERAQRAEASRERVVDRLHAELQEYKQDLLLKVQRPIFIDLIQLHDDIGKMIEARAPDESEPERAAALRGILESIQTAIEDILYRQGVEPFSVEGVAFDPRRQRAVSTVASDDPGRNKTIAARLRKGFQSGEKLIRPEIVSVYTVCPAPAAKPGSETDRPRLVDASNSGPAG
jgi:molecular chaperone GrpE